MKTFQYFIWGVFKSTVAVSTVALVLTGCATVDLEPDSSAPQVRMPGSEPVTPTPVSEIPVPQSAPPADVSPAGAQLITLTTRPDGASAVPPTSSSATAQIDLVYDTNTHLLRWKAQWSDLSGPITAVTFYGPAAQGQQGPPTLIWPGPFGPRYEGRATLTPQQATDLTGGLWYVNISTENYPGGEIRGQLIVVY
jgi:hypothetical protein